MQRSNDNRTKRYFQSDRLFTINSQWFFMTRETQEEGPFRSRLEAENALQRYVDLMCSGLGRIADKRFQHIRLHQVKAV